MIPPNENAAGGAAASEENTQITDDTNISNSSENVKNKIDINFTLPLPQSSKTVEYPPSSNTGGKSPTEPNEKPEFYCDLDWLAVSFPEGGKAAAISFIYQLDLPREKIHVSDREKGWNGFESSADLFVEIEGSYVPIGLLAYGGHSQRGKTYLSLNARGCDYLPTDRGRIEKFLLFRKAKISRVDLAMDDMNGHFQLAHVTKMVTNGEFCAGGRLPQVRTITNSNSSGDTLEIGSRKAGKLCRIYEKGKQLGDRASGWLRFEVELLSKDRRIPIEVVSNPEAYLYGAYPVFEKMFSNGTVQPIRIKTMKAKAQIAVSKMMENVRQQTGPSLGFLLRHGVAPETIIRHLARPAAPTPKRLRLEGIREQLVIAGLLPEASEQPANDQSYTQEIKKVAP